jgi:hypothetical protein
LSKIPMIAQSGVSTQKSNLANNIRKSIMSFHIKSFSNINNNRFTV